MLSIISPAKKLNLNSSFPKGMNSGIQFQNQTRQLVNQMKQYQPEELQKLMNISSKLSQKVFDYYERFDPDHFTPYNARPALFMFDGDVYKGIQASTLTQPQCEFAQKHLLILSGLYGLVRPMDLIQPYRLEMGTKIRINGHSLYQFWQETLVDYINQQLKNHQNPYLINLASNEYSQVLDPKRLNGYWLDIQFKEYKNGKYRTIPILAKRARGLMVRFMVENAIDHPDKLKSFDLEGYAYHPEQSKDNVLIFTRFPN